MSSAVKKSSSKNIDFTSGPILSKIIKFFIPIMLTNLFVYLFNLADMAIIGIFCNDDAIASMSTTTPIFSMINAIIGGLPGGAGVLISKMYGAKNDKGISDAVHTSIAFSAIAGIVVCTVGVIVSPIILQNMNVPEDIFPDAKTYITLCFISVIPSMIYNYASFAIRSLGNSKNPLFYITTGGIMNVVLNVIFVAVFKLGVFGVGVATVISMTISAVLAIRHLIKETGVIHLDLKKLHIHKYCITEIIRLGMPSGIQSALFSFSNVLMQAAINTFTQTTIAGEGAAQSIDGITCSIFLNALMPAILLATAQNHGAGDHKRVIKIQKISQVMAIVVALIPGLIVFTFKEPLLSIIIDSEEAIAAGVIHLTVSCFLTYVTSGIMNALSMGLNGLGHAFVPTLVSTIVTVGFRVIWLNTVFKIPAFHRLEAIYILYPISYVFIAVIFFFMFIFAVKKMARNVKADNQA